MHLHGDRMSFRQFYEKGAAGILPIIRSVDVEQFQTFLIKEKMPTFYYKHRVVQVRWLGCENVPPRWYLAKPRFFQKAVNKINSHLASLLQISQDSTPEMEQSNSATAKQGKMPGCCLVSFHFWC